MNEEYDLNNHLLRVVQNEYYVAQQGVSTDLMLAGCETSRAHLL